MWRCQVIPEFWVQEVPLYQRYGFTRHSALQSWIEWNCRQNLSTKKLRQQSIWNSYKATPPELWFGTHQTYLDFESTGVLHFCMSQKKKEVVHYRLQRMQPHAISIWKHLQTSDQERRKRHCHRCQVWWNWITIQWCEEQGWTTTHASWWGRWREGKKYRILVKTLRLQAKENSEKEAHAKNYSKKDDSRNKRFQRPPPRTQKYSRRHQRICWDQTYLITGRYLRRTLWRKPKLRSHAAFLLEGRQFHWYYRLTPKERSADTRQGWSAKVS